MIANLNKRQHLKDKRFIHFQVITEPEFIETVETLPDESDSDSGVIEVQSVQVDEQVNEKATDVDVGVTMDRFCLFSQMADSLETPLEKVTLRDDFFAAREQGSDLIRESYHLKNSGGTRNLSFLEIDALKRPVSRPPFGLGLQNMTNTCYISTVLQQMYHNPILMEYFMRDEFKTADQIIEDFEVRRTFQGREVQHLSYPTMLPDESRQPLPPTLQAFDFAHGLLELRNLFREMSKATTPTGYVSPKGFIDSLSIPHHQTKCANEFWATILWFYIEYFDLTNHFMIKHATKRTAVPLDNLPDPSPFVSKITGGSLIVPLRSSEGSEGNVKVHTNLLTFIAGDVEGKTSMGEFKFDNDDFRRDCIIHESLEANSLPAILTVDLSRIVYEGGLQKNSAHFAFPSTLRIHQELYELRSVIIHTGDHSSGGHYYVYIKNYFNEKWYCFNDMAVTEVHEQQVIFEGFGGDTQSNEKACATQLQYMRKNSNCYNCCRRWDETRVQGRSMSIPVKAVQMSNNSGDATWAKPSQNSQPCPTKVKVRCNIEHYTAPASPKHRPRTRSQTSGTTRTLFPLKNKISSSSNAMRCNSNDRQSPYSEFQLCHWYCSVLLW